MATAAVVIRRRRVMKREAVIVLLVASVVWHRRAFAVSSVLSRGLDCPVNYPLVFLVTIVRDKWGQMASNTWQGLLYDHEHSRSTDF